MIAGVDEPVETRALQAECREEVLAVFRRQLGEFALDLGREGDDFRLLAAGRDSGAQCLQVRPLIAGQLRIGDVGGVEDRLCGEQRERLQDRLLVARQLRLPQSAAVLEEGVRALEGRELGERFFIAGLGGALHAVQPLLHGGEVGEGELELDDLAIAHGIDAVHHVQDVVVVEAADDVHDRVRLADVGEELVAESLALGRALDESGDVHELDGGGHGALRADDARQLVESRIGEVHPADVRVLGRERIVGGEDARAGERIEERRLANVRKADDAESEHGC